MKLKIDEERYAKTEEDEYMRTGMFVRAQDADGKWISVDILALDKESLLEWLRSRGGDNPWAEDVVGILMGHGHLHPFEDEEEK